MNKAALNFQQRVEAAWCRETSMSPDEWSPENKALGQCAVTAALSFEEFGIPIVRGQAFLPDGTVESHYWNEGYDLTASQYPEKTRTLPREGPQGADAYDYLLTNPDLVRRLEILRDRYNRAEEIIQQVISP